MLQGKLLIKMREVNRYDSEWRNFEKDYKVVTANQDKAADATLKKAALTSLATNRFLWAPMLNALQYTLVDGVQITHIKTEQGHTLTEGTKTSTNSAGIVSKAKPATSRQKVLFVVDAKDLSSRSGDQIFKFQEKLNAEPYFKTNLEKIELTGRSQPQTDPANPNRPFVQFTLECRFPDEVR
jgi:hypothetical protein